jgi:hypothetical protein
VSRAGQFPTTLKVTDALGRSDSVPIIMRVSLARPPSTFTKTGSLTIPRSGHTATLLTTGEVLVTGGGNGIPDKTAELYNPATGTFTRTADVPVAYQFHGIWKALLLCAFSRGTAARTDARRVGQGGPRHFFSGRTISP